MSTRCRALSPPPPPYLEGLIPPPAAATSLIGLNNNVNINTFYNGLWLDAALGAVIMFAFMLVHRRFKMYHIRLHLPQISTKPPPLAAAGFGHFLNFWHFWWQVLTTEDYELLKTAGMDALVLTKVAAMGVKLFLPTCFFGLLLLWPLHYTSKSVDEISGSNLLRHTISNIPQGSALLWVHFVFVFFYNIYAMMLLRWHYHWYVKLRQHYMTAEHSTANTWQQKVRRETEAVPELNNMLENLRVVQNLGQEPDAETADAFMTPPEVVMTKRHDPPSTEHVSAVPHLNQSELVTHACITGLECVRGGSIALHTAPATFTTSLHPGSYGQPVSEAKDGSSSSKFQIQDYKPTNMTAKPKAKLESSRSWGHWWDAYDEVYNDGEDTRLVSRKPSVRERTTINTVLRGGKMVSVNAAQYMVLVTDVEQPPYDLPRNENKKKSSPSWWTSLPAWFRNVLHEYVLLDDAADDKLLQKLKMEEESNSSSMRRARSRRSFIAAPAQDEEASQSQDASEAACLQHTPGPNASFMTNGADRSHGSGKDTAKPIRHHDQRVKWADDIPNKPEAKLKHWEVVRQAIQNGRIFAIKPDVVTDTFSRYFPDEFERAIPVINHLKVDRVIQQWDRCMARLEIARAQQQQTGQEPTHRLGWAICGGCCGGGCSSCCGNQVLSIEYYEEQVQQLEKQIKEAQREAVTSNFTPSWFVFFKTQKAAAAATSTVLHAENNQIFQVSPAPGPENVNWEVLWLTRTRRTWRRFGSYFLMIFIVCFPISIFASGLAVLDFFLCQRQDDGKQVWPGYCNDNAFKLLKSLVTGWLPGILLSVYQQMIIPRLMYWCAQLDSTSHSLSGIDQRIMEIYFYWDVFNVFLQSLLGTTIVSQVRRVIECSDELVRVVLEILGNTLPTASTFFFIYIWLRGLVLLPYRLLIPHPGVICYLVRGCGRLGVMSARQKVEMFAPRSIRYGIEYGILLLLFLIGLAYSVVSPLLAPVVLLYFMVAYMFWRYTTLYVYVRKYESGGVMWPRFFSRMVVSLGVFTFFTAMVLMFKGAMAQGLIILVIIPYTLHKFHSYCWKKYELGVSKTPLELACKAPVASVPTSCYIPPPMQQSLAGWHPEWHKAWEGMGALSYSVTK